ncbi:hypothetical protein CapIbe_022286 [Capra ibex]
MSGPRGEFKRGTVFSLQVLATVSPGSQRFPGKRFLVRRWTRAQCLHRESAQQGKVRLLSTKMDCNLPPLMREEHHVSTRSLTPLLMLENPEGLLPGSTFKRNSARKVLLFGILSRTCILPARPASPTSPGSEQ